MAITYRRFNLEIWGLALGYFAFYLPYSGLTKVITSGQLPGAGSTVDEVAGSHAIYVSQPNAVAAIIKKAAGAAKAAGK